MTNLTPRQLRRIHENKSSNFNDQHNDNTNDITYFNYMLTITYDGTNFGGYAKQKFSNTIEETINTTIDKYLNTHVKLINSSRTDAKVHAYDQKIMFKFSKKINADKFLNYVNENLPKTIEVTKFEKIKNDFHVRFDVSNKTYIYKIHTEKNIFLNNYSYFWNIRDINVQKIDDICTLFLGEKDFKAFSSPKRDSTNTIRTINYFKFYKTNENSYQFEINANGFLYNMIRILVSSILYYYENNYSTEDILYILEQEQTEKIQPKISPAGLYLYEINFN